MSAEVLCMAAAMTTLLQLRDLRGKDASTDPANVSDVFASCFRNGPPLKGKSYRI